MLQFLRKNTKIIVWFAVILMIGVFGLTSVSYNKHEQYAGEVFGKKISFQEFRIFETITRMLPPSPQLAEDPQLEHQFIWQQMILAREAQNKGFQVSDSEVRARVDQLINLDNSQRISQEEYVQVLKGRRTTPYEFENGVRELIRIQKMLDQKFKSSPALPAATTDASPSAATAPAVDELKQKQEEYVRWMTDIFARSKTIDYSQLNQKSLPPETAK